MVSYHLNDTIKQPVFSGLDPAVFTIPVLIIVGENDAKAYFEAKRIHRRLHSSRKWLHSLLANVDEPHERQTLYLVERDTELQGHRLLDPRLRLWLHPEIKGFIYYKLVLRSSEDFYKWTDRSLDSRPVARETVSAPAPIARCPTKHSRSAASRTPLIRCKRRWRW